MLGEEGGEAIHTLTTAELPRVTGSVHFHSSLNPTGGIIWKADGTFNTGGVAPINIARPSGESDSANGYEALYLDFGGSQPHNNMPPYRVVNIWEKISD